MPTAVERVRELVASLGGRAAAERAIEAYSTRAWLALRDLPESD
jgi:geranylgeranyl pyrophosphate synthase